MGNDLKAKKQVARAKRTRAKFFRRQRSIWAHVATGGAPAKAVWVSTAFKIVGLGHSTLDKGWSAVITFDNPYGAEYKFYIPFATLVRDRSEAIAPLAHRGLMVNPSRLGLDLFCEFLLSAASRMRTLIQIRMGLDGSPEYAVIYDGKSKTSPGENA